MLVEWENRGRCWLGGRKEEDVGLVGERRKILVESENTVKQDVG